VKKIILKVLGEVACGNTGTCQINLQSESAQQMIAEKIEIALQPYVRQIIEEVVAPAFDNEFYSKGDNAREI
jgi:hypothetical protein